MAAYRSQRENVRIKVYPSPRVSSERIGVGVNKSFDPFWSLVWFSECPTIWHVQVRILSVINKLWMNVPHPLQIQMPSTLPQSFDHGYPQRFRSRSIDNGRESSATVRSNILESEPDSESSLLSRQGHDQLQTVDIDQEEYYMTCYLWLDGCKLPPLEASCILKDGDKIDVDIVYIPVRDGNLNSSNVDGSVNGSLHQTSLCQAESVLQDSAVSRLNQKRHREEITSDNLFLDDDRNRHTSPEKSTSKKRRKKRVDEKHEMDQQSTSDAKGILNSDRNDQIRTETICCPDRCENTGNLIANESESLLDGENDNNCALVYWPQKSKKVKHKKMQHEHQAKIKADDAMEDGTVTKTGAEDTASRILSEDKNEENPEEVDDTGIKAIPQDIFNLIQNKISELSGTEKNGQNGPGDLKNSQFCKQKIINEEVSKEISCLQPSVLNLSHTPCENIALKKRTRKRRKKKNKADREVIDVPVAKEEVAASRNFALNLPKNQRPQNSRTIFDCDSDAEESKTGSFQASLPSDNVSVSAYSIPTEKHTVTNVSDPPELSPESKNNWQGGKKYNDTLKMNGVPNVQEKTPSRQFADLKAKTTSWQLSVSSAQVKSGIPLGAAINSRAKYEQLLDKRGRTSKRQRTSSNVTKVASECLTSLDQQPLSDAADSCNDTWTSVSSTVQNTKMPQVSSPARYKGPQSASGGDPSSAALFLPSTQGFHTPYQQSQAPDDMCYQVTPLFMDYDRCPKIKGFPEKHDVIAYKILELSEDYTPCFSSFKEAEVLTVNGNEETIEVKLRGKEVEKKRTGRFEMEFEELEYSDDKLAESNVQLLWPDLMDVRLVCRAQQQ